MNKPFAAFFTLLILLLLSYVAGILSNIQEVQGVGEIIYILSDGSISPPTAPIRRTGTLYTLLGNVSDQIVVQRSNIVIDGDGYTIEGTGGEIGFLLEGARNVTIQKTNMRSLLRGVSISNSSDITLWRNNISESDVAFSIESSVGNHIYENVLDNNHQCFWISGANLSEYLQTIEVSNTVNGKPVYYLVNQTGMVLDSYSYPEVGFLALVNCANMTIQNFAMENETEGLLVVFTRDSRIVGNLIANNDIGIEIRYSSYNIVNGNNFTGNIWGIHITDSPAQVISQNNFSGNSDGIHVEGGFSEGTIDKNTFIGNRDHDVNIPASWTATGSLNSTVSENYMNGKSYFFIFHNGTIRNNNFTGPLEIESSDYVAVYGNEVRNTLTLSFSDSNRIFSNRISGGTIGINVYGSSRNEVFENQIENNTGNGVNVMSWSYDVQGIAASANKVYQNNITNNQNHGVLINGVWWAPAKDCIVSGNNLTDNGGYGIYMANSCWNSTALGNTIKNSSVGIVLGWKAEDEVNKVGCFATSNAIANCTHGLWVSVTSGHTISSNIITNIVQNGIELYDSSNNTVFGNNVTNCFNGIWLSKCFHSTFSGNSIIGNQYGVGIDSASNNTFHHNNFVNNSRGAYIQTPEYVNHWDNGSEGNYWSDYVARYPNATEVDSLRIWNTPYDIETNNVDRYPLMDPYVVSEFTSTLTLALFIIATLLAVVIYRRKSPGPRFTASRAASVHSRGARPHSKLNA